MRLLLTGISGVGKSTVCEALARRGCQAVDLDCDDYSHWVAVTPGDTTPGTPVEAERDWVWREERVEALLASAENGLLVVSGCAPNLKRFLARFDLVVLLSAPPSVLTERLVSRANNAYGKRPEELARVLELKESVEPRLRAVAHQEIDTSRDLATVIAQVEALIRR